MRRSTTTAFSDSIRRFGVVDASSVLVVARAVAVVVARAVVARAARWRFDSAPRRLVAESRSGGA